MAPPTRKNKYWLIMLALLSLAVMVVLVILGYLLLTLPASTPQVTPTSRRTVLDLPTAAPPTPTSGPPPAPLEARFNPEEPLRGFANCETYGFRGVIKAVDGAGLAGVQIVAWKDRAGLLDVATTDSQGKYTINLKDNPAPALLWLQVYQNDEPVSAPVPLEIQVDCQNGFQLYQVDWQEIKPPAGSP